MERMAATMGCGIAARIPPNLPALNENNIIRKTLKVLSMQINCFFEYNSKCKAGYPAKDTHQIRRRKT
jgi:hypothetical protein